MSSFKKARKVNLKKNLSLKDFLLSSVLVDIVMALIILIGIVAISTNLSNTNKKVKNNTSHIEQLEMRLEKVENEIEELGYFINTSVDENGQAYIEINGLRDSSGNVVDFDEYVNVEEFQNCVAKIDECLAHQITDYNYVKTLNSSEKVIYSVYDNGIAIDGLIEGAEALSFLELPETVNGMEVTSIGASCFKGLSFTAVKLPKTLTFIGPWAFKECKTLCSVEFYSTDESKVFNHELELSSSVFEGCAKLNSISLPETLKHIKDYTFVNCKSLNYVEIPDSVLTIGNQCFYGCNAMTYIKLSENLISIGSEAFYNCYNISNLILPETLTSIGVRAFYGMSSLKSLSIPDNVSHIGASCFSSSLTYLELPAIYQDVDKSNWGLGSDCKITYRNA